jgi:hypothetical protein
MKKYLIMVSALLCLMGCAPADPGPSGTDSKLDPDPDAVQLLSMSRQATELVQRQSPDAVLHQIDTDLRQTTFLFTDRAATREISVNVAATDMPLEQWAVRDDGLTPLIGNTSPGLRLDRLRIGPRRVAQAIIAHWPGCELRGLNLYDEDSQLTWAAFCTTQTGVAAGTMNAGTGVFQPSNAPPAPLPVIATPHS